VVVHLKVVMATHFGGGGGSPFGGRGSDPFGRYGPMITRITFWIIGGSEWY
jgi:hypothetical protein